MNFSKQKISKNIQPPTKKTQSTLSLRLPTKMSHVFKVSFLIILMSLEINLYAQSTLIKNIEIRRQIPIISSIFFPISPSPFHSLFALAGVLDAVNLIEK
jgi:hypothetical protein